MKYRKYLSFIYLFIALIMPLSSFACGEVQLTNNGNYYMMLEGSTKQWRYVKNSGTCGGPCEIICDVQMGTCFSGTKSATIPGVTDIGATYTMYYDAEALRFYDDGNLINVGNVYINDVNDFGECEPEEPEEPLVATSTSMYGDMTFGFGMIIFFLSFIFIGAIFNVFKFH